MLRGLRFHDTDERRKETKQIVGSLTHVKRSGCRQKYIHTSKCLIKLRVLIHVTWKLDSAI